jgi:hypothetical protein
MDKMFMILNKQCYKFNHFIKFAQINYINISIIFKIYNIIHNANHVKILIIKKGKNKK